MNSIQQPKPSCETGRQSAYAPSGQHLAAGCEVGSVHMVAPESGAIISSVPLNSGFVRSLAYAPSGQHLAAGCENGSVHMVAPESGSHCFRQCCPGSLPVGRTSP